MRGACASKCSKNDGSAVMTQLMEAWRPQFASKTAVLVGSQRSLNLSTAMIHIFLISVTKDIVISKVHCFEMFTIELQNHRNTDILTSELTLK